MKNGYRLLWSEKATIDLQQIIDYLKTSWTEKEIKGFVKRLDKRLNLILINPRLFPKTTHRRNVRRSVLTKHITIYYTTIGKLVKIVALFDSRQDPRKLIK